MTVVSMDQGKVKATDTNPIRSDGSKKRIVHNQVLRIREEDQRIGEGIGEGLSVIDRDRIWISRNRTQMETFLCSRPILPSSPLGNKTAINSSFG